MLEQRRELFDAFGAVRGELGSIEDVVERPVFECIGRRAAFRDGEPLCFGDEAEIACLQQPGILSGRCVGGAANWAAAGENPPKTQSSKGIKPRRNPLVGLLVKVFKACDVPQERKLQFSYRPISLLCND